MRGCPVIAFPPDMFSGLVRLQTVFADNFKLCCPAILPADFNVQSCQAPSDHLSSCDALLRSPLYRVFLASFAALALVGNLSALAYRLLLRKEKNDLGYDVFVTNLCVSDFLMGVYLSVVGVADRVYMGEYFRHESDWKEGIVCKFAGFTSFLSSEVSALLVCLITLDRVLVLRFPFSTLRFRKRSAQIACAVAWLAGALLALVPLLPVTSHWQFYARTGMCVPLPVTRNNSSVYDYTFRVLIVLNFFLFFAIAAGQAAIFWSVRINSMSATDTTKKGTDLTLARRLITIAIFDFACWFPIGLMGFMTSTGVPVASDVHVTLAIFVLPLKPALNPFIYTINVIMEKRRQEKEEQRRKILLAQAKIRDATTRPAQR
ncbi:G-protein coupled receptor GRL101-like [Pomacea canaliculata]|uniref:G-protein coupled receptor GRL101-like n=1 Tax=Pomacea canaliculata TaxID=400727 RepID=UPI000D72DE50|nr:G-protein coupled receptor GRL101-like [Pomacea canaliculata]